MAALDGLRVLDMTQYEAGTSCTQALAWLGADVVKVERPDGGDPGRGAGGDAEYFVVWNSNKRSVAIDLRSADGRALFMRMVPKYDVFVENYGPGVIERLDIGYEAMRAVKSDIIYARIKGFGVDGLTTNATTWWRRRRRGRFRLLARMTGRLCDRDRLWEMRAPEYKWRSRSRPPTRKNFGRAKDS